MSNKRLVKSIGKALVNRYRIDLNGGKANANIATMANLLDMEIEELVADLLAGVREFRRNGNHIKILEARGVNEQWLGRGVKYKIEYKGGKAIATAQIILRLAGLDTSHLPRVKEGAEFLDGKLKVIKKVTREAPIRTTKGVDKLRGATEEREEEMSG